MDSKKSPVKIAIVSGSHFLQRKGGAEYQLMLLAQQLTKNQHSICNIFRNSSEKITDEGGSYNFSYKTKKVIKILFGNSFYPYAFDILKLLYRIKPDIVMARPGGSFVGICALYCRLTNTKLIWHISIKDDLEKFKWRLHPRTFTEYLEKAIFNYGIKSSDFIVGQAQYQDDMLLKNFKRNCDIIIPNFHPTHEYIGEKGMEKINVIWIANFKKQKQPELFLALAESMKKQENVNFIMAGRLNDSSMAKAINSTSNLEYLGELAIEQVLSLMKESHIFINTSSSEGFPNTFIQAWLNKMVVVSLTVNPDDVLTNHDIGYVAGNFQNMKETTQELIAHPELILAKGEASYDYAIKNHSLANIAKYEEFILACLNGNK